MRGLLRASALAVVGLTVGRVSALESSSPAFRAELALRWAPIHHQDVNQQGRHSLGGSADYIRSYDFDGDRESRNNWENAADARHSRAAHAYFAVVETRSHWFVSYLFFHPRDWSSTFFDTEHENDAEGVLFAVERDGSRLGSLQAAITVAHRDFYSYVPAGSGWRAGRENIDGVLTLRQFAGALRPVTAQEAEGHGLKAWPYYAIKGDGVVYYPSLSVAEAPASPNDRHVLYQLHDVLEPGGLWENRHDPRLFAGYGVWAGNSSDGCGRGVLLCRDDAAHTMWAWNDHDDAAATGAMAHDPVALAQSYFAIPEPVTSEYTFNPFQEGQSRVATTLGTGLGGRGRIKNRREQGNGARL